MGADRVTTRPILPMGGGGAGPPGRFSVPPACDTVRVGGGGAVRDESSLDLWLS